MLNYNDNNRKYDFIRWKIEQEKLKAVQKYSPEIATKKKNVINEEIEVGSIQTQ